MKAEGLILVVVEAAFVEAAVLVTAVTVLFENAVVAVSEEPELRLLQNKVSQVRSCVPNSQ